MHIINADGVPNVIMVEKNEFTFFNSNHYEYISSKRHFGDNTTKNRKYIQMEAICPYKHNMLFYVPWAIATIKTTISQVYFPQIG
jgi:hypothetical protein